MESPATGAVGQRKGEVSPPGRRAEIRSPEGGGNGWALGRSWREAEGALTAHVVTRQGAHHEVRLTSAVFTVVPARCALREIKVKLRHQDW